MHRATVISPLWAEVTSRGVAFVRCLTFGCEELVCSLGSTFPGTLKRFLPDHPAFCSRERLTIRSCVQNLDMNITRIIQHKEQEHKGMKKWTQVMKEDRKIIAFLVLIIFMDCLVLVTDKYIKCIQY